MNVTEEGFDVFPEMAAGALIVDSAGVCLGQAGDIARMLDLPEGMTVHGRNMDDLVAFLSRRGDFGPYFKDGESLRPGFFVDPRFRDAYIETPSGRVVNTTVNRRQPEGWIVTLTDMTEMKQQVRSLWHSQAELEQIAADAQTEAQLANRANEQKTAFLAAMSHEIRTPMSGLIGMVDVLSESPLDGEQRAQMATLQQSGESLLEIINGILDFSKIEAGHVDLQYEPFDLLTIAEDVVAILGGNLRGSDMELALVCAPDAPTRIMGDAQRLRQILLNVIGNAVKFTDQGKVVVEIAGRVQNDKADLTIVVRDTGIGIPEKDLDTIFAQYQQSSLMRSTDHQGTGLGLAIVTRLLGMMGGEILATSPPGAGAVFTMTVAMDLWPHSREHQGVQLQGKRVLCIDPLAEHRQMLSAWLGYAGGVVKCAADLAAAHWPHEHPADIVLLHAPEGVMPDQPMAHPAIGPETKIVLSIRNGQTPTAQAGETLRMPRVRRPYLPGRLADQLIAAIEIDRPVAAAPDRAGHLRSDPPVRLLIAEDNPINRKVIEKLLAREPIDLNFAPDGQAAIDAMAGFRADMILMDLSMPVLDGISASRLIRGGQAGQSAMTTPIVALTANVHDDERDACAGAGIDQLLSKPIRREDLLRAIAAHVPRACYQAGSADPANASSIRSIA